MPILVWDETELRGGKPVLRKQNEAKRPLDYRLLVEDKKLGHGDGDNLLIQGDNLEALQSLLPYYAGSVKCIFIDPPYNTGSAFTHYDDGLEHSAWLSMMKPRLELLRQLLAEDGSIWVTIDDNEAHYLKVLMDMVFGRANFVANVVWEKSDSPKMDSTFFSSRHDHILVFAKNAGRLVVNRLAEVAEKKLSHYNKTDAVGRRYYLKPLRAMGSGEDTREARPTLYFALAAPDGSRIFPKRQDGSDGRWRWGQERIERDSDKLEWVKGRAGWTPYYKIFRDSGGNRPPETIWPHAEVGSNRLSKAEIKALFPAGDPFTTPKPEKLINRLLLIATKSGDLVLDSFAGSGTTLAAAHKMNRRWIGIEMGDHAVTHCQPRLMKVVDGEQGGISEAVNWKGGGGFRFFRLGDPVFNADGLLNEAVRFDELAAHIWFTETQRPYPRDRKRSPLLGIHEDVAYALFYNGIWGEQCPDNTLGPRQLTALRKLQHGFKGKWVIYANFMKQLSREKLKREGVEFRQLPHDVKGRTQ